VKGTAMNRVLAIVSCILACVLCVSAQTYQMAPEYVINLDLPPSQRWNQVVADYKTDWAPVLNYFDKLIPPVLQALFDPIIADMDKYIPAPYGDALRGIAEAGAPHINLGQMIIVNLVYELTAFCTSIVAQQNNGTILHGRNLDYNIPGLRALTIQVDFQSQNQTIYKGVTWAGYVGLLTGLKPGAFGYTVDERDTPSGMMDNIMALLVNKGGSIGFNLRNSLGIHDTFEEAIDFVQDIQLMAPVYIIVSGSSAGQGAIVTRDREYALDVWPLSFTAQNDNGDVQPDPSAWYRVQTNYDRWNADPSWDRRRIPAEKALIALGQNAVSLTNIFTILSTPPVFNAQTVYTCLMSPTLGEMVTFIRWDAPNATKADAQLFQWHTHDE